MKITAGWAGFLKQIVMVIIMALVSYLAVAAHLTGVLNPALAILVASIFSGLESSMKASSDGTKALFGAVRIK